MVNLSGRGDKDVESVMAFDRAAGKRPAAGVAQDWADETGPVAAPGREEE